MKWWNEAGSMGLLRVLWERAEKVDWDIVGPHDSVKATGFWGSSGLGESEWGAYFSLRGVWTIEEWGVDSLLTKPRVFGFVKKIASALWPIAAHTVQPKNFPFSTSSKQLGFVAGLALSMCTDLSLEPSTQQHTIRNFLPSTNQLNFFLSYLRGTQSFELPPTLQLGKTNFGII